MQALWRMTMLLCALALIGDALGRGMGGTAAEAATWTRRYIHQLPDTAFASVERTPDGRMLRHLPHHDADGKLDVPHLCSALGRLHQVKWAEPGSAEAARTHLQQHLAELGRNPCRPVPRASH